MASRLGRWGSPERTMVWTEPNKTRTRCPEVKKPSPAGKVAVVYYLCRRNGQLDHPHFMEVALSDPSQGRLYLRDVMDRLNMLRGDGMANLYSWSSKRSYKNGYVWHDLTHDDLVHPAHGDEYVLKGSELLLLLPPSPRPRPRDASASSSSSSQEDSIRRKNWSSFDLGEYRVAVRNAELSAADAATQTDDRRPEPTTELGINEISPPPSSSSPETLETLIKNDARVAAAATAVAPQCEDVERSSGSSSRDVGVIAGGRMRASAVLMQLISCGSSSITGTAVKDYDGDGVERRGRSTSAMGVDGAGMGMDRDYFSGSLIETTDRDHVHAAAALKRSSSYNAADRRRSNGEEEEEEEVRAMCIPPRPRKPKAPPARSNKNRSASCD